MRKTPSASRLQIAVFGRRNAGKSSIVNALVNQPVAIVSEVPGTTTDPVFKSIEIHGLGPCMIVDTAGLDDAGVVGELRVARTRQILDRTDLALLVMDACAGSDDIEIELLRVLAERNIPALVVANKIDKLPADAALPGAFAELGAPIVAVSALCGTNIETLKEAIKTAAPREERERTPLAGLVAPNSVVLLVMPQDLEAPKGRLILPQVQTIRDALDRDTISVAVKADRVKEALAVLRDPPALVITDSQAFERVAKDTPPSVPLTSFSIVFTRLKGDLAAAVAGAETIDRLKDGDAILIAEACTHHPIEDDIARVKIPNLLKRRTGREFKIRYSAGHDFPCADDVKLVIHCGSCMLTRTETMTRYRCAIGKKIPITNYGIAIAHLLGILPRALKPFGPPDSGS
ncbi:MAG: [FeFe] hydrogenase H-cluster maturation GTPase HydF [Planctomycetota bacterium]|nr:[FeFe] hydrogenase H-cluster maturation GTPase HydF [Planctomycetota bacterium]